MILELAAGYGAIRLIQDLVSLSQRREERRAAKKQDLVPVKGAQGVYEAPDGSWTRMQQDQFAPGGYAPTDIPAGFTGQIDVTDFEIAIRGRTVSYRP